MSPKNTEEEEDTIKDFVVPEFKSTIPGYIADGLTPKEKHVLEALSIIGQKQDLFLSVLKDTRDEVKIVKKRTNRYEKLLLIMTSKWSVVLYIVALLYPIVSNKLVQKLFP